MQFLIVDIIAELASLMVTNVSNSRHLKVHMLALEREKMRLRSCLSNTTGLVVIPPTFVSGTAADEANAFSAARPWICTVSQVPPAVIISKGTALRANTQS